VGGKAAVRKRGTMELDGIDSRVKCLLFARVRKCLYQIAIRLPPSVPFHQVGPDDVGAAVGAVPPSRQGKLAAQP
jgi:hypothetical protein